MGKDDFGITGNKNCMTNARLSKKLKECRHLSFSGCQSKGGDSV